MYYFTKEGQEGDVYFQDNSNLFSFLERNYSRHSKSKRAQARSGYGLTVFLSHALSKFACEVKGRGFRVPM